MNNLKAKLKAKFSIDSVIATFFGIGKVPFAPGTFGSIAATIIVFLIYFQPYLVQVEGEYYTEMGAGIIPPNLIVFTLIWEYNNTYVRKNCNNCVDWDFCSFWLL